MDAPIEVLIADDHPVFREGLVRLLEDDDSFEIVGHAGDGETALAMIRRLRPDIAVLDIDMPKASGLAVAESIRRDSLDTDVVFLTMYEDPGMFRRALDIGARGYVLKDSAVSEIASCLHMIAAGKAYISPALSGQLLARADEAPLSELEALVELTPAERRVLQLVARGLTSAEIADQLGNSPKTIENHRSSICAKLGLSGPQALLRFALENKPLLS